MITAELLRSWGARWTDEQIAAVTGGASAMSPRELASRTDISSDERMWVLGRTLWHLDEHAARLFAIETALTIAHLAGDEDDKAIFRGIMNDLLCAEDLDPAARDAARDVAADVLWQINEEVAVAAWSAACDAAGSASWFAASDTALTAAKTAAAAATRDAKMARSIERALGRLGDAWNAARAAVDVTAEFAARAAWNAALRRSIARALEWLGDYADGWEES